MPNTLITPNWVTKSVAAGYVNFLVFASNLTKEYNSQFEVNGAKMGDTINVRLPQRFTTTHGQALQTQNIFDQTTPVTLNDQINVAFAFSSAQRTTSVEEVRERYVKPAAQALANAADVSAYSTLWPYVYSQVGTPGTIPNSPLTYLQAGGKLDDLSVSGKRFATLDIAHAYTISNASTTLFNPTARISAIFREGDMGGDKQLGIDEWRRSQSVQTRTTGTFTASTPLVNGANQTGSTININGWANGATTLRRGDKFTIAGVFTVNPVAYSSTPRLQQFVVTADTSDAAGVTATLPISPSIITSGQLQTVSNSPATGAVVTVVGATSAAGGTLATTTAAVSLLYTKDFGVLASADLVADLDGATASRISDKEMGMSIRMAKQYQIGTDQNDTRFDILIGPAVLQARNAVAIEG
jgi:hypothetical protein